MRLTAFLATLLPLALTGCAVMNTTATPSAEPGISITGKVHGGQQPIVGAHVYLFAANTTGYGGPGIAPSALNASTSLLTSATGNSDTIGNYVPTAADGSFTITSDYACTPGQQVYLYALGGNPGAGANSASGLLAALGSCPTGGTFPASQTVWVNEVSTIAAAYAFAGFASDATHVSSSGTTLAQTGIANAFANATNLVNPQTGAALATTPVANGGNGTVPQQELNTLANILASCVNSTGPGSTPCSTLFTYGTFSATTPGNPATDTATAAINIAHHPSFGVSNLYNIPPPVVAFAPALTQQPNDFTVALSYPLSNYAYSIAIDASGNAWMPVQDSSVIKLGSTGAVLSGANGFTGGGLGNPGDGNNIAASIAIDPLGNAWINNASQTPSLTELSPSGTPLPGTPGYAGTTTGGYTGGGLSGPWAVSIDGLGEAWAANFGAAQVSEFSPLGAPLSGSGGYTYGTGNGGLYNSLGIANDGSGNAWVLSNLNVAKVSPTGAFLSGANGFTSPSLQLPSAIAFDSLGNAWVADESNNWIVKISNSGTFLNGNTGYTGGSSSAFRYNISLPGGIAVDGAGTVWIANYGNTSITNLSSAGLLLSGALGYIGGGSNKPAAIAVDGSGNVWITNSNCKCTSEFLGAATPVITPIAAGLPLIPTTDGSSNLGTRP